MNAHITICQHCGKAVNVNPGFCVLCGEPLGKYVVLVLPAPKAVVPEAEAWIEQAA